MSASANPDIVDDGLVLCLDAGDPKSYNGNGTTWFDRSGQDNNAISQASASTTEGRFNSNGYFDLNEASDVYFLISGLNNYDFGSNLTVDFWIKNTGGDYRAIVQNSDTNAADDTIDIRFGREDYYGGANNGTRCRFNLNSSSTFLAFYVPLNVWTHVTCTFDGSTMRVYTNGEEFSNTSYSSSINQSANDMKLFRHYNTGEDLVNPFASIRIYNKTFTAAEVAQNFKATRSRFGV
jgi:hypothetical protein